MSRQFKMLEGRTLIRDLDQCYALLTPRAREPNSGSGMRRCLDAIRADAELKVVTKGWWRAHDVVACIGYAGRGRNKQDMVLAMLCPEYTFGLMVSVPDVGFRRHGWGTAAVDRIIPYAAHWTRPPLVWRGTENAALFWQTFMHTGAVRA